MPARKARYWMLQELSGDTVVKIHRHPMADEGVRIVFGSGKVLDVGYSGDEGMTVLNGVEVGSGGTSFIAPGVTGGGEDPKE